MKAQSRSSSIRTTPSKRDAEPGNRSAWTKAAVLRELESLADPRVRAKMEYFGVHVSKAHGISAPVLHAIAKRICKDPSLALDYLFTHFLVTRIRLSLI